MNTEIATLKLTEAECERLTNFFDAGAALSDPKDAFWIDSSDGGEDYCLPCVRLELVKEIARFRRLPRKEKAKHDRPSIGGGYRTEHDGTPFCEICQALLDASLTNYACELELKNFLQYGFDVGSDEDRRSMSEVIRARQWEAWSERTYRNDYERENDVSYFNDLHTLGRRILEALDAK